MKRLLFLIIFGITLFSTVQAQTYSEKANMYDTHQYRSGYNDPYDPTLAGVASFFIPGLGQMICDESSRGLAFLGGYVGCFALTCYGFAEMYTSIWENMDSGSFFTLKGGEKMAIGTAGMLGISLWSIIDAVHVAKVNNMYFQDHNKRTGSINLEIAPYTESILMCNQSITPVGLTLRASF